MTVCAVDVLHLHLDAVAEPLKQVIASAKFHHNVQIVAFKVSVVHHHYMLMTHIFHDVSLGIRSLQNLVAASLTRLRSPENLKFEESGLHT